jgi:hypothetical protein
VDWLRTDTLCTLYIDYAEVYDNDGWNDFIADSGLVAFNIKEYASEFSNWDNIKYWIGTNEPYTIDSYIPIRTVDSLLRENGSPPLMVQVYPYWDVKVNEDSQLVRYYKTVKPEKLIIDFYHIELKFRKYYNLELLKKTFNNELKPKEMPSLKISP